MIYIVFYDITSNKIRNKLAKLLIAEGFERLQFSVYTGLTDILEDKKIKEVITQLLAPEPEAKFYVLPVLKKNFKKMKNIGIFDIDLEYLTGDKRSLTC